MAMMAPRVAMRLPLLKSLVWLDWAKWGAVPGSPSVEQDTLPLDHQHHSPLTHKSTTQGVAQSASLQDKKWPRRNGDDGHQRLPLLKSLIWLNWWKQAAVHGSPAVEQNTLPLDHQHHSPLTHKSTTQGVAPSTSLQDKKWPSLQVYKTRSGPGAMAMTVTRVAMRLPLLKSLVWLDWAKWGAVPGSPAVEQDTLPLRNQHHWLTSLQYKEWPSLQVYKTRSGQAQWQWWPPETTIAKVPGMTGLGKVGSSP